MKNKKAKNIHRKAKGMEFEVAFDTKTAAKAFYRETKEELDEEKIPASGKISYKRKGKKVIFKGNRAIAVDMLADTMIV